MKTDSSIKNISVAAIKRKSIDLNSWTRTKLVSEFPIDILPMQNELAVVYVFIDINNWTLVTTQRIIGLIDSIKREINFLHIDDVIWGAFKNTKIDKTIFRTIDQYGDHFYKENEIGQ
jgi:hypothetical protein